MRMETIDSPLGRKAPIYLEKSHKNAGILLKTVEQTLEFYPAGYTDTKGRQQTLKALWQLAVSMGTENTLYPFSSFKYNIEMKPWSMDEEQSMLVTINAPSTLSRIAHLDGHDLGWCPMRITDQVYKNRHMIRGGRILKIRNNYHNKYYTAKVIFGYGDGSHLIGTNVGESTRFVDIAEEISND